MGAPLAVAQPNPVQTDVLEAEYPAPPTTPQAAGERFYQLLALFPALPIVSLTESVYRTAPRVVGEEDVNEAPRYDVSALSREQFEKATNYREFADFDVRRPENILAAMARQKDEPQFAAKVVGQEGEATLVEVEVAPAPRRALVVVPEGEGYRVDLKATYGRWNSLSGKALDLAWYKFTGDVADSLVGDAEFNQALQKRSRDSCQSHLKQVMLGALQYAQDYDDTFPGTRKWIDDLAPYVRTEAIFRCPALPAGSNYGYALNQNLNQIKTANLDNITQTVAIYETTSLVRNECGTGDERAYRHMNGSNIAFVDGHVKWYREGEEPQNEVSFKP